MSPSTLHVLKAYIRTRGTEEDSTRASLTHHPWRHLERWECAPAAQLRGACSTWQLSVPLRGWRLQPHASTETLQGTKDLLPASLSHCDPAIVQAAFRENDGHSGCRTCTALNKAGKEGELHKSNSRPVYQQRLNGLREKEQEVRALALTGQRHGEESGWMRSPACRPRFAVHTTLLLCMRNLMGEEKPGISGGPDHQRCQLLSWRCIVWALRVQRSSLSDCLLHLWPRMP